MTIEVYSFGREVPPWRTLAATVLLLIISCGLALGMSWKRASDPLVSVATPPGWAVRFRVPRAFEPGEPRLSRRADALPYFGSTTNGEEAYCILWKGAGIGRGDLADAAQIILDELGMGANWFGEIRTGPPEVRPMGDREALELRTKTEGAVIRIVSVEDDAYAVLFATKRGKMDDVLYQLFDLTCRSMVVRP